MAPYFDYGTPQLPDLSEGISKMGDALTVTLDRKRQERQFASTQAFQREQEARKAKAEQDQQAYQNRTQDERNLRDKAKFAQDNAEFENKAGNAIASHLADADVQGATAIAARTPHFDPATGQTTYGKLTPGTMRDVGPEPTAQPAAERPREPAPPEIAARRKAIDAMAPKSTAEAGPVLSAEQEQENLAQNPSVTPESAQAEMAHRATAETDMRRYNREFRSSRNEQAAGKDALAEEVLTYPQRQAEARQAGRAFDETNAQVPQAHDEWLKARRQAENEVPYSLQFGKEAPVTMDVQTQRYQHRQANADDLLRSLPPGMTEADKRAAQNAHAAILAGTPMKDVEAAFLKERMGITGNEIKVSEGEANRANRLEIAKIPKPGLTVSERSLGDHENDTKIKRTREDIERSFKDAGLDKAGEKLSQIKSVEQKLNGNARDQQTATLELMRAAMGNQRLNQYIERRFGASVGVGSADQLANRLQQMWDGGLGDQARSIALETAGEMRREMEANIKTTAAKTHKNIAAHPEFYDPTYGETVLEQTIPGYTAGPASGAPPEVRARQKGAKTVKLQGMTPEQLDEQIQRLQGNGGL